MEEKRKHPSWCSDELGEVGERKSHMVVVHPDAPDDATVRAWLTRMDGSDTGPAIVTIEVEDIEMRARRVLTTGLTRVFINALVDLRRMRRAGERRAMADGHPAWCSRLEKAGEPHRSREVKATEKRNDDVIRVWLAQGASQEIAAPMAYVGMRTDGVLLEWPPLTRSQHHALTRRLSHLLDQLHTAGPGTLALPRST